MTASGDSKSYLTKHLFGAGLECSTKLYYYSQNYPEDQTALPFIRNAIFNKRLVKALARSAFPDGVFVEESSIKKAAETTKALLEGKQVVVFDAIFEHNRIMARLPIVCKQADKLTIFHTQIKAFDSRKHRVRNSGGNIRSKWRSYLLDFAFQIYVVKQHFPEHHLKPYLILPERSATAFSDNLISKLKPLEKQKQPKKVDEANQQLLAKIEVSDLISTIFSDPDFAENYLPKSTFSETVNYLRDIFMEERKVEPEIGMKCKNCEFRIEQDRIASGAKSGFHECWQPEMENIGQDTPHVFDLIGAGTTQRIQNKIYHQRDINAASIFSVSSILNGDGRISQDMRQALQIHQSQGTEVPEEIIRPALYQEIERWRFPLHFLDFEAGNYALPIRKNRNPYHLVVFQFSCHTLNKDGKWSHYQWIDNFESEYPNYELIRQLKEVPNITDGTIVQYSDFERQALKTIRRELLQEQDIIPDADVLLEWIEPIIHRNDSSHHQSPYMADLSRLVKHFYYNSEMGSSLSIKDVLRSVMNHSSLLKEKYSRPYSSGNFEQIQWWQSNGAGGARNPYELLTESGDSPIRRGTEAMVAYGKLRAKNWNKQQLKAYREALLKYCELDTLAMMMIYQHWQHRMLEKP